jgi:hypothetical protein
VSLGLTRLIAVDAEMKPKAVRMEDFMMNANESKMSRGNKDDSNNGMEGILPWIKKLDKMVQKKVDSAFSTGESKL